MANDPIFIFSCGGRTGSTWLQRLLTSTGKVLVWGETGLFRKCAEMVKESRWTRPERLDPGANDLHKFREEKSDMWCSNLLPLESDLYHGFAAFLKATLGDAARNEGYQRWGCKEIDWSCRDVEIVRTYLPDAKIVFLTRRLEESYLSFCRMGWAWNEERCQDFIDNWLRMTGQMISLELTDREKITSYENLTSWKELRDNLFRWLDLPEPKNDLPRIGYAEHHLREHQKRVYTERKPAIDVRNNELGYEPWGLPEV